MKNRPFTHWGASATRLLLVLALGGLSAARAEDIDLFLNSPLSDTARPNLLIVVDNAASNNSTITQLPGGTGTKKLDMLKDVINVLLFPTTVAGKYTESSLFPPCALPPIDPATGQPDPDLPRNPPGCVTREEVNTMLSSINLGLMIYNSGNDKGGYVRSHLRPMNDPDNRLKMWSTISSSSGIPSANNAPYAKSMHEAYLYFSGKAPYVGFSTNQYDPDARNGSVYRTPLTDACQPNFVMYLGNGGPDTSEDNDARTLLNGLGGVLSTDPLRFTPDNLISSWFDEYARTLNKLDISETLTGEQKITTYTVAIQNPADNTFNNATMTSARALLQNAALQGGGEYALARNGQEVLSAIVSAIRKMQPVNSVFAAVTLPVSVNVRGTFLNQVYMGQFRPDRNARPRWPGNLKQYQIGLDANNKPVLVDSTTVDKNGDGKPDPNPVEDTAKGFLLPDITSFWTKNSSFWSFTTMNASDAPDGAVVEKGGAAQRMRADLATAAGRTARKLYTCNGPCAAGTSLSGTLFNVANTDPAGPTATKLGVSTSTDRDNLIEWVRGADNFEDENKNGSATDARAYIHGDLLHSRPAVVNYNRTPGDRDIVVYYGSNDGIFRAVKGGQDPTDGYEKWGFIFPEFMDRLRVLRDNNTVIGVNTTKPYFADGSVSIYQKDANNDEKIKAADGDKVWLFVGMRRGGRMIYALDVSDPDDPKFMWKIDQDTVDSSGTKHFATMGQSWSAIRPTALKINSGKPVLIFGGGYDPEKEDTNPAGSGNNMGQGIYIVDAETGKFLKHITHADMGAIPADLTLLDRDGDGKTDRIYAPDTKGNVWRADVADADMTNWTLHKIGSFGGTGADARKFLNKVDVVFGKTYDAVLVGSGDREHPFLTSITDRFYMLKDTFRGTTGGLFCGTGTTKVTCTHSHLTDVTSNSFQGQQLPSGSNGWYLTMAAGEKLVSSPITVFGTVIFGTNRPTPTVTGSTCGNLGEARLYQINFENAGAVSDLNADGYVDARDRNSVIAGGGYLPSAVWSRTNVDGKNTDVVCVGTHCFTPGGVSFNTRRYRTYWYKK